MLQGVGRWLAMLAIVLSAQAAPAACGDDAGDAADVAAARGEIETTCACDTTPTHPAYVACARGIARTRVEHGDLGPQCRGTVMRCVRRSTCGCPGAVTCCRTTVRGVRCTIRRSDEACVAGCVGAFPSCCDACGPTGCVTTSTTTSTTIGPAACGPSKYPSCGGTCPSGERCVPFVICDGCDTGTPPVTNCVCASDTQACGDFDPSGFFDCGAGPCPPNGVCTFDFFANICGCQFP
jgi:hypothetical protein